MIWLVGASVVILLVVAAVVAERQKSGSSGMDVDVITLGSPTGV